MAVPAAVPGSSRMGSLTVPSTRVNAAPVVPRWSGNQWAAAGTSRAAFDSGQWRGDRSWRGTRDWRTASNWRGTGNWQNRREWRGDRRWRGDRYYRSGLSTYVYGGGLYGYPYYSNAYYGGYDPYYYDDSSYYDSAWPYDSTTYEGEYVRPVTPVRTVVTRSSVTIELQRRLARAGFYQGPIDGIVGPGTRAAIVAYERSRRLPVIAGINVALLRDLGIA